MNVRLRNLTVNTLGRFASYTAAAVFAATAALAVAGPAAPAQADGPGCSGSWSVGIGGFVIGGGQGSEYVGADQRVGYNSWDPMSGVNELNRLYWDHRSWCPNDYIKVIGHSEGAGIAHAWVSASQGVYNTSAVLIADPKRSPGPGSAGLANNPAAGIIGYPLAGTDSNFGGVPVLQVCNHDDVICNEEAGWWGYAFGGAHGRYAMAAWDYPDYASGVWFN